MFEDFKNAFSRYNNGHVQLIIINIAIFLIVAVVMVAFTFANQIEAFDFLWRQLAIPSSFSTFLTKPWTILTYSFLHSYTSIFHIVFNMLFLYWFGRLFVEYLGSDKLIAVYILGALAGAVAYLLVYNTVPYFAENQSAHMVGASAAVYAVVVATAVLIPDYTMFLLFLGPVRIKYIAAFYIVLSFIGTVGDNAGGNIAHLGGALMGVIYIKQLQAGVNWGSWITVTLDWIKDLFKPRPKVKVSYRKEEPKQQAKSASSTNKKHASVSQAELDAILDKISDGGYESLTKEEKEKLFNASKK
jgi:membrane associated rhomboid family serine protease